MYGPAHGLAYLLDPRFLGQGLPAESRNSIEEILYSTPIGDEVISNDVSKELIYMQFTAFLISESAEKANNTFRHQMLVKKRKTPLEYWLTDGAEWPELQQIAVKIFCMAASNAASERNFSTMGFIHSKKRNSLSVESVEKLVFIKTNMNNCDDAAEETEQETDLQQSE